MGNTQTVPASSQSTSGIPVEVINQDPIYDGVRISEPNLSMEARLREAFEKGKKEGQSSFESVLDKVAAEVYDNVHSKLAVIQQESLAKSEILSQTLKTKLSTAPAQCSTACNKERTQLVSCLNDKEPLACNDFVDAYTSCASSLIQ